MNDASGLRRLTPEEGEAVFRRAGVRPVQLSYLYEDGSCGCLLGALAVDALGRDGGANLMDRVAESTRRPGEVIGPAVGLDAEYAWGLDRGFTMPGYPPAKDEPEAFRLGYEDGRAIARRVLP